MFYQFHNLNVIIIVQVSHICICPVHLKLDEINKKTKNYLVKNTSGIPLCLGFYKGQPKQE